MQQEKSTYKRPKKGWAIFMVIVILLMVASGGFFFVWNKNQINQVKNENEEKINEIKKVVEEEKQKREEAEKKTEEDMANSAKEAQMIITDEERKCKVDSDCVPNPAECHPKNCLNKEYEEKYKPKEPMACTMMIDTEAAYQPENCGCQNEKCINLNLGKE
jgi:cytoskeletal protein RodZ